MFPRRSPAFAPWALPVTLKFTARGAYFETLNGCTCASNGASRSRHHSHGLPQIQGPLDLVDEELGEVRARQLGAGPSSADVRSVPVDAGSWTQREAGRADDGPFER
jgi:hypothetical protein